MENGNQVRFYEASDISEMLGISKSSAYRIIKRLNAELESAGKIVVAGKIYSQYFESKLTM